MSVHRIRPEATAFTRCPAGHEDAVPAINPVVRDGQLVEALWPSALDFCMECEQPVTVTSIEVQR